MEQVLDSFSIITKLQSQMQTKSLQVRFYNLQNGTDIWIDALCWRCYDFDMEAYLRNEFGIEFNIDAIAYDIMDASEEFIAKTCFKNGVFSKTLYDEVQSALTVYDEEVVSAAIGNGLSLNDIEISYVGKYTTFEQFCKERWMETESENVPEQYHRLINFAEVADMWQGSFFFDNGHVFYA